MILMPFSLAPHLQVVLTATAVVVVLDKQYRPKRISRELREHFETVS